MNPYRRAPVAVRYGKIMKRGIYMSIELTTRETGKKEILYDGFCEQGIDSDVNLPDYCPDIMRILKCCVHTDINSSKLIGDRVTADGNAKITVIYSDEKNNICSYSTDYPFSKYVELSSSYDDAMTVCTAKTDYINCRAVSKRRLDMHGVVSLHFTVSRTSREKLISSAGGDGIQLKRKGIDVSSVCAAASKCFQLSEVANVGDTSPGIGKILSYSAAPIISDTKIIKGKLLIKGELTVNVLYCSDSTDTEAIRLVCNLPFNEIIEAADFSDSCTTDIKLNVTRLTAEPKVDNDGDYRYMNISAEICACATAYDDSSVNVIKDAYSTDTEIDTKYSTIDFNKIILNFSDSFSCRQNVDISSLNPQKVFAAVLSEPSYDCTFNEDKMYMKGKVPISLIVIDGDGAPVSCEREAEFEYSRTIDGDSELYSCSPMLCISGFSCNLNGDGTLDFKAEMSINAVVFKKIREKVLTSLSVTDSCQQKEKKSSLTVYFCSGKESLWDIARRYNTTVEEIMEENELSADYLENKTMLMIPIK